MLARDMMSRDVISVTPETSIVDAANLLLSERLSSAPVVDAQGRLTGIVSERDFIHRMEIGTGPRHGWWQTFSRDPEEHTAEFLKVHGVQVSHVMTRRVVTAEEETTLGHIVDTMDRFDISQVPIVRGDKVVGMVSRSDILRLFARLPRPASAEVKGDDEIRQALDALLRETAWATVTSVSSSVNRDVKQGVVSLGGVVGSERERAALLIAVSAIPGVKAVEADLAVVPKDIAAI